MTSEEFVVEVAAFSQLLGWSVHVDRGGMGRMVLAQDNHYKLYINRDQSDGFMLYPYEFHPRLVPPLGVQDFFIDAPWQRAEWNREDGALLLHCGIQDTIKPHLTIILPVDSTLHNFFSELGMLIVISDSAGERERYIGITNVKD